MNRELKFLIGTLHSGENEFAQCQKSILNQNYSNSRHVVFSDLENQEAHNKLYDHFMKNANDFDYFIKIDADMIIEDPNFLDRLNKYLNDNKEISRLTIPIFDNYTDEHILGVNVYRNYVKWDIDRNEKYFVDRIENTSTIKVCKNESSFFKNSISHCANPNLQQTYMFGYHRTLKAFQPDKFLPNLESSNWKRFYYIYHNKLNKSIYRNVFRGINDALSFANSTKNNSYKLQFENSIKETNYSSSLSFLFSKFHPNFSYVLVYIYMRLKFVINFVYKTPQKSDS